MSSSPHDLSRDPLTHDQNDHAQPEEELTPLPTRTLADDAVVRSFVIEAARLAADLHCTEVIILDTRGVSPVADYLMIASGASDRQIRGVAHRIAELAKESDMDRLGHDTDGDHKWLVLDFAQALVHLFEPATRGLYDLEMLWGECPRVSWRRA